jgi:hypothetical protein
MSEPHDDHAGARAYCGDNGQSREARVLIEPLASSLQGDQADFIVGLLAAGSSGDLAASI